MSLESSQFSTSRTQTNFTHHLTPHGEPAGVKYWCTPVLFCAYLYVFGLIGRYSFQAIGADFWVVSGRLVLF